MDILKIPTRISEALRMRKDVSEANNACKSLHRYLYSSNFPVVVLDSIGMLL